MSITRVVAVKRTPWLRSARRFLALAIKWSDRSGTFLMTRRAQREAYREHEVRRINEFVNARTHFLPDVRVAGSKKLLDLVDEIP